MFNHVGHLALVPGTSDEQVEAILTGLLGLPRQIDGLAEAQVVRDAGLGDGNATLRFHMRFESEDAWRAYGQHPAHVAVVQERVVPVLSAKAFVQYDDADVRIATA